MDPAPTHPTVAADSTVRPDTPAPESIWAEQVLAHRAAVILAAARQGDLTEVMADLVGDLVEAAAALALAVLGERGLLGLAPVLPEVGHPGWVALHDAVVEVDPDVVRLDHARRRRVVGAPQRWARQAHP